MRRVPIGLRRRASASHARVGAAPAGFALVFPGWNVWSIWQALEPDHSFGDAVLNAGVPLERQLRIWVEDTLANVPGVAVRDTFNPADLRGDKIEILPNAGTLSPALTRESANLGGALHLGKPDAQGTLERPHVVRFFNRGAEAVLPWPRDKNYLLDTIYQPDSSNPITNAEEPGSLAGGASSLAGSVVKIVAVVAGVGLGAALLVALLNARKS